MTGANVLPENGLQVTIGGLSRDELIDSLSIRGILLNEHAETLLSEAVFDEADVSQVISVVERTVGDLGLSNGAPLSAILATAQRQGLSLCPPITGPYLRLVLVEQVSAPDSVMSSGRAPAGSLTVAAPAWRDDDDFPKGFYLRVIDGTVWLRGYTCDDEHLWSPDDRFAFQSR